MSEPRILVYDIENSPSLGWVWQKYQTDVVEFKEDWYLLCFAYKWLGGKTVKTVALPDFPLYKREPENDYHVASELWHLFNEADIVVAHNGNRFDQAKARARFLVHGFEPHTPFREIDTLQVARKRFNFTANNLDELCRQLGIGRKEYTGGIDTWLGCMRGDTKSWATMLKYNKRDVAMLEELYLRFRPWMENHPNIALISGRPSACPKCGSEEGMVLRKHRRINTVTAADVYQCKACGGYSTARVTDGSPKPNYK